MIPLLLFWASQTSPGQKLTSGKYAQQKGPCEDLDEGKMSLPVIHCLQNSSPVEKAQITGIFKNRDANGLLPEMKTLIFKHLDQRTSSLEYTRGLLKQMERDLKEGLEAVESVSGLSNPLLKSLLAKLVV